MPPADSLSAQPTARRGYLSSTCFGSESGRKTRSERQILASCRVSVEEFLCDATDALDRFGTQIEHRFTVNDVMQFMASAGLERIEVSDQPPYWCAVGYARAVCGAPPP